MPKKLETMDEECEHRENEECTICHECGECREDVNNEDICTDCRNKLLEGFLSIEEGE